MALAAFVLVPIIPLILRPLLHGGVYTGVTGLDPYDEYQYLAWIRDTGSHGLSADLFGMTGAGHVYLQPMWLISGVLWRLGSGLQISYLIWSPISVVVLWYGYARFARWVGGTPARSVAILVLGLFFASPISWLSLPTTLWVEQLGHTVGDATAAVQPWFDPPTAIALGISPLVLMGCERLLLRNDPLAWRSRLALATAAGAALVSWVHSWQGIVLLLIMLGVTVTREPRRGDLALAAPIGGCALPLLYQWALTRSDVAWELARRLNDRPDLLAITPVLAVLGPLLAAALFGLARRLPRNDRDWMLVLWPLAAAAVYRFDPEFPPHALEGAALPLSALAVRGWPAGRPARVALATCILAFTMPGLVKFATRLAPTVRANDNLFWQTADEHAALDFLAHAEPRGGVLAPMNLSLAVPAFTDLDVWDGHKVWTPPDGRPAQAAAFFADQMPAAGARRFVLGTHVRWVLADCPGASATIARLGPVIVRVRRFGCAEVGQVG